jgi:hypothetical protein
VDQAQIVGITLVRDEDLFVERAVRNVVDFCDEVIVIEHRSIDDTPAILARLAREDSRIRVHAVSDPRRSHAFVTPYVGRPVWVVGFDGDQLFDPAGLASLRRPLLDGELDSFWSLPGRGFNCLALDPAGSARGHHAPPSRGTPKLLNFGAIDAWDGPTPERLHGGTIHFRPGYGRDRGDARLQRLAWEETPLRWLHVCFLRRSSRRPETTRLNPAEAATRARPRERLRRLARRALRAEEPAPRKLADYAQGPVEAVDARPFFPV